MNARQEKWRSLQEKINAAVEAWRREHPEATLTEIEEAVDHQVAALRRQMVEDLAQRGRTAKLKQQLVEHLTRIYHKHRLRERAASLEMQEERAAVPRIVCSEALF